MRRTRDTILRGDSRKANPMKDKKFVVRMIAGLAILTAIVVVLQMLGSFIKFGPFSISLVLIPIVVGAAVYCPTADTFRKINMTKGERIFSWLYGPLAGAWLGLVFSIVVLMFDAAAFLAINVFGTVVTVLLKGTLAGFVSGIVYTLLRKWSLVLKNLEKNTDSWEINLGVVAAAIVCPVVNTGIFLLGCLIFFLPTIREWAAGMGYENAGSYMIFGLVGGNFLFELLFNLILSPVIVQIISIGRKSMRR